ncbi:WD repeat-containing protein 6 [Coemansia erecta]|nr:WD repeat-containing protein 6 [Coemansia erecta]
MPNLVQKYQRHPATSVEFLTDSLLAAANGGTLDLYDTHAKIHVCSCRVFYDARIHGIVPQRISAASGCIQVLVFGSKMWTVIRIFLDSVKMELGTVFEVNDWIKAGHWVQDDNNVWRMVLALAHSQVYIMDIESGASVYTVQCTERCILYAATFYGDTLRNLTVGAGTVFNQVLLWNAWTEDDEAQVQVRLQGHEGVVFGVRFSGDGRRIMSVSDDRSIRVWDLNEERAEMVLYGHSARIWSCVEVGGGRLLSAAEDGTCRVWRDGETEDVWRLCPKNVWAAAAHCDGRTVAAACGDGAVYMWSVGERQRIERLDALDTIALPDPATFLDQQRGDKCPAFNLEATPKKLQKFIRGFALTWDSALVVTNHGHILRHLTADGSWHVVAAGIEALRGYAMVAAEPGLGKVAAIGLRDGTALAVRGDDIRSAKLHTCSVWWLAVMQHAENVYDIITLGKTGDIVWSQVTWDSEWRVIARAERPIAGMRISSAAVSSDAQWLAVGSATGSVYVYNVSDTDSEATAMLRVACAWPQAHGRQTVSALNIDVDTDGSVRVMSGGRDGWMRTFQVLESVPADAVMADVRAGDVVLHCVASAQVTRGWVEQFLFIEERLYAVTFFRKRLELVDVEAAHVAVSTVCAGGLKLWQVVAGTAGVRIGFVKDKLLRSVKVPLVQSVPSVLAVGISASDIRAVCAVNMYANGIQLRSALVGGEDGHMRVVKCDDAQLNVLADVRRHRSAIRCIRLVPGAESECDVRRFVLSAGAGSELRCWRLDCGFGGDAWSLIDWALAPVSDDSDLRIMDMAVVHRKSTLVWIVAVYSDASVVLWKLDIAHQEFVCVARAPRDVHAHCVFSAASVKTEDSRHIVLTGASDGQIIVWDVSAFITSGDSVGEADLSPHVVLNVPGVHQSGVNSMCARADGADIVVASGGDDCSVVLTSIGIADFNLRSVVRKELAHASAVQGVSFIGELRVCSVSTDQRIAVWNQSLELQHMAITQVADPSALHVSEFEDGTQILVAGIGFESFAMPRC